MRLEYNVTVEGKQQPGAGRGGVCRSRPRLGGYRPLVAPAGTLPRQATVSTAVFVTPLSLRSHGEGAGSPRSRERFQLREGGSL